MIVVFNETCVPDAPFVKAFSTYQKGIAYEVGVSISQADADKYVADGRAAVAGQEGKNKLGTKPGSKESKVI